VAYIRQSDDLRVPGARKHPACSNLLYRERGQAEICYQLVLPLARGRQSHRRFGRGEPRPGWLWNIGSGCATDPSRSTECGDENARAYGQEREAANEMREIDRLRGQFLMRMSHQLATYLNTIIGFSRLMLKGLDGPVTDAQAKDLTAIRHSGQQLSRLLDDILELANLEVGTVEMECTPVNLADLASDLQTTLSFSPGQSTIAAGRAGRVGPARHHGRREPLAASAHQPGRHRGRDEP